MSRPSEDCGGKPSLLMRGGAGRRLALPALFARLDGSGARVPLEVLLRSLRCVRVGPDDLQAYARFDPATYKRNLMRAGPGYEALMLCWRSGQQSPVHDHGDSNCAVLVVRGVATEVTYTRDTHGLLRAGRPRRLVAGTAFGSVGADLHRVLNDPALACDLITLHVYSPPLRNMQIYEEYEALDTQFRAATVGRRQ